MTPMAAIPGFSRHGHIYVPTSAKERAQLAWFSKEAEERRSRAGSSPGSRSVRCSPGFFGGAHAGSFCNGGASVSYDPWFSNGNTDIEHYLDYAAEELYLCGGPASGNLTGSIAGNVLSPVTTPAYQQALTGVADDPLGAGFDAGTQDSFDSSGVIHSYGTNDFCALVVFRGTTATTTNEYILGNGQLSAREGWWLRSITSSRLQMGIRGAGGNAVSGLYTMSDPQAMTWAFLWRSGGYVGMRVLGSDATANAESVGAMTSIIPFSIGATAFRPAVDCIVGPVVIWSSNVAAIVAARATKVDAWAAATGVF